MKTPAPQVVIDDLDGPKVVLTVLAWVPNALFGTVQSDLRLAVRETLTQSEVSPPVPVPPPAVAPWQPAKKDDKREAARPN
jgi:hypothetical protein